MILKPLIAAALTTSFLMVGGCKSSPDSAAALQAFAPQNGVNSYLWRATLETLDFMPLDQTDVYWQDANVDADTARQIENSILTRARELFIATEDAS